MLSVISIKLLIHTSAWVFLEHLSIRAHLKGCFFVADRLQSSLLKLRDSALINLYIL